LSGGAAVLGGLVDEFLQVLGDAHCVSNKTNS
jgi:hypothetical protein